MKKYAIFSTLMILSWAATVYAATDSNPHSFVPANDTNLIYVGRFDVENELMPEAYWSGAHIRAGFTGDSVAAVLESITTDRTNYVNIIIDDSEPILLELKPGIHRYELASDLEEGSHELTIYKRTSHQAGGISFQGLELSENAVLLPLERSKIKIEFFGDSITDGHSVDAVGDNKNDRLWNNYNTYAAIASRRLGLEAVFTASSGVAVHTGWGSYRSALMPNIYDRLNPFEDGAMWDFSRWTPEVVVINLFSNDAGTIPPPHDERTQFSIVSAYYQFLKTLRGCYPDAEIVCTLGSMGPCRPDQVWPDYIRQAVKLAKQYDGDDKLHTFIFSFQSWHHPNTPHHEAMAEELIAFFHEWLPSVVQLEK